MGICDEMITKTNFSLQVMVETTPGEERNPQFRKN